MSPLRGSNQASPGGNVARQPTLGAEETDYVVYLITLHSPGCGRLAEAREQEAKKVHLRSDALRSGFELKTDPSN